MKDAAKKFRKTCEKCNKPFSTANESEVLCRTAARNAAKFIATS